MLTDGPVNLRGSSGVLIIPDVCHAQILNHVWGGLCGHKYKKPKLLQAKNLLLCLLWPLCFYKDLDNVK